MLNLEFVCYCSKNGHNKIWGWFHGTDSNLYYNFWGRFGSQLTFKLYEGKKAHTNLIRKSETKLHRAIDPYDEVRLLDLERIIPGFGSEMENQLIMAKLGDKFHGMPSSEH